MRIDPIPRKRLWLLALQVGLGLLTLVLGILYFAGYLQGMLYLVLLAAAGTAGVCCIPYHPEPKPELEPWEKQKLAREKAERRKRRNPFGFRD